MRKFVDALAFAALVAVGCAWSVTAFGQNGPGYGAAGYPLGAAQVANAATATTGGIALNFPVTAPVGQYTYVCGFSVSPGSATAAITLTVTLGNVSGVGSSWVVGAPVTAVGVTGNMLLQTFTPCLRSNATAQQITMTVTALGAGGINQVATMWGFIQ